MNTIFKMPFDMTEAEWQKHKFGGKEYFLQWLTALNNRGESLGY